MVLANSLGAGRKVMEEKGKRKNRYVFGSAGRANDLLLKEKGSNVIINIGGCCDE